MCSSSSPSAVTTSAHINHRCLTYFPNERERTAETHSSQLNSITKRIRSSWNRWWIYWWLGCMLSLCSIPFLISNINIYMTSPKKGIQEMFRQKLEQATISYFTTSQANEKLMIDPRGKFKRKCDVLFKNKFVLMVFNIMNNVLSHCDCSEVHSRLVQWQIHSSQFPGEGRRRI